MPYKINPKIGQLFVLFKKHLFIRNTALAPFWATLVKIGLLLLLASGHTAKRCRYDCGPEFASCHEVFEVDCYTFNVGLFAFPLVLETSVVY